MRYVSRVVLLLTAPLLAVGCHGGTDRVGGPVSGHPRVLRLLANSSVPNQVAAWAQEVERATHGTLVIRFSPNWRSSDPKADLDTLVDVRRGRADLAWVGARTFDLVGVRGFQPLLAPLLIDSYPLEQRVLADPHVVRTLAGVQAAGVQGLALLPGPMRRMLGVRHPFLRPADFRGQVVGIQGSAESARALRLLGAVPRAVPPQTSLDGLDGYEQQLASIVGNQKLHGGRYVTANLDLWPRPLVVIANDRTMRSLTAAQRGALRHAWKAVLTRATKASASEDANALPTICGLGLHVVNATPAGLRALRSRMAPIYRAFATSPGQASELHLIDRLKTELGAPPAALPSCPTVGAAAQQSVTSPVDGTYQLDVSPAALRPAARLPENYGAWKVVIDQGRFRFSQGSDGADWTADGAVALSGNTMTWAVRDALDVGPHGTPDGVPLAPGQDVRFHWQKDAHGLALTPLDASGLLPGLSVGPLRRVAPAPSQRRRIDPAPLQGEWKMTVAASDVTAHHGDPAGIPDNTGPLDLKITGNRFRWVQRAPDGTHYGFGTLRFAGDTMELDATGTDESSAPSPEFYSWSVYRGELTLKEAPGFSAEVWTYHPWQHAG